MEHIDYGDLNYLFFVQHMKENASIFSSLEKHKEDRKAFISTANRFLNEWVDYGANSDVFDKWTGLDSIDFNKVFRYWEKPRFVSQCKCGGIFEKGTLCMNCGRVDSDLPKEKKSHGFSSEETHIACILLRSDQEIWYGIKRHINLKVHVIQRKSMFRDFLNTLYAQYIEKNKYTKVFKMIGSWERVEIIELFEAFEKQIELENFCSN